MTQEKKYKAVRQMVEVNKQSGEGKKVYPVTPIQAVYDARTGASLEAILAQFNNVFLQYQGSAAATRCLLPKELRRVGITISYRTLADELVTERCMSDAQRENEHWGLDVNWARVDGQVVLSGELGVSEHGTWVVNGVDTGIAAQGPKGDTGLTPWLKTIDNKLHYSYDGVNWEVCSTPIAAYFRVNNNKMEISRDNQATWEVISDYIAAWFRWSGNKIQISRDNKTWTDFSGEFADNLFIKGYVATYAELPTDAIQGDIWGVGPTNADTNPTYRYYVRNAGGWVDNGEFTSIAAGIVQETGDGEGVVMSQKAVSEEFGEVENKVGFYPMAGLIANGVWYDKNSGRHIIIPVNINDIIIINPNSTTYYTLLDEYSLPVEGESANFATGYTDRVAIAANKDVTLYISDAKYLYLALGQDLSNLITFNKILINGNNISNWIAKNQILDNTRCIYEHDKTLEELLSSFSQFIFEKHYYKIAGGKWDSYGYTSMCYICKISPSDTIVITPSPSQYVYYSLLRSYTQPSSEEDVVDFATGYTDRIVISQETTINAPNDAYYLYVDNIENIISITINGVEVRSLYQSLYQLKELIHNLSITREQLSDEVNAILNKSVLSINQVGGILYADGQYSNNPDKRISGYIKVAVGEKYLYNTLTISTGWAAIAAYDEDLNYIQELSVVGSPNLSIGVYTIPIGVEYIIITGDVTYQNNVRLLTSNELILNQEGGILYADGRYSTNNEYRCTSYLPVEYGDIITCVSQTGSASWAIIAMYDDELNYIQEGSVSGTYANISVHIPEGVRYIRITCSVNFVEQFFAGINIPITEDDITHIMVSSVNTVSALKYPNILGNKACLAIQMDVHNLDNSQGHMDMLSTLREYGLMSMDYATFIDSVQSEGAEWLLARQKEGCEIIYHNQVNSPSDVSSGSTLTVEEAKQGVWNEKRTFIQRGFTPFGMVAQNGNLGATYKPIIDNLFAWSEYGSYQILDGGGETTKEQYQSDHRINRTGFEIVHAEHSAEIEQEMITKGKEWIDGLIQNASMGVMYCHHYDRPELDNYGLYPNVLRGMCEYIVEKIINGELYYGSTTECLNYLCGK